MLCKDGCYQLQAANELVVLYSLWHEPPGFLSPNKANICDGNSTDTSNLIPGSLKIVWMVRLNLCVKVDYFVLMLNRSRQ